MVPKVFFEAIYRGDFWFPYNRLDRLKLKSDTARFGPGEAIDLFSHVVTWFEMGKQQFKMADA